MKNIRVAWTAVVAMCLPVCRAELQPRLGGAAVYDTDLNITWLTNANLAKTYAFGTAGINSDGSMEISTAQNWIKSMNLAKYLGFSTWRLPSTPLQDPTCNAVDTTLHFSYGYGCSGSE